MRYAPRDCSTATHHDAAAADRDVTAFTMVIPPRQIVAENYTVPHLSSYRVFRLPTFYPPQAVGTVTPPFIPHHLPPLRSPYRRYGLLSTAALTPRILPCPVVHHLIYLPFISPDWTYRVP